MVKKTESKDVVQTAGGEILSERSGTDLEVLPDKQAIVVANPLDLPVAVFKEGLDRRKTNRHALIEWVKEALVEGVDFGRLHFEKECRVAKSAKQTGEPNECKNMAHWSKAIMFQPGAQKVCGMLGVTAHFPALADYEQAAIEGKSFIYVVLRCELRDGNDRLMAVGGGARKLEKDYGDLNKSIKMTEKSAHINATLKMGGLSELFTQPGGNGEGEEEEEFFNEQDVVTLYNVIKDSGLYDNDEKIHRQLTNLARQYGHDSLLKVPRKFYDTLKAALEKGIEMKRAKTVEGSGAS